jgi:hypothetical protein
MMLRMNSGICRRREYSMTRMAMSAPSAMSGPFHMPARSVPSA